MPLRLLPRVQAEDQQRQLPGEEEGEVKPLAIELFAGLHGWGEGFLLEGYRVVGFDIVDMCKEIGVPRPDGDIQLVLQDVLTLHGSQFRNAAVIVASPPCQFFSRMAMPFKCPWGLEEFERRRDLALSLFHAGFRIAGECGIPLVVENVKGAQRWVGRAKWHYGSFYLWGDVPALMPSAIAIKNWGGSWFAVGSPGQTNVGQNPDGRRVKMNFHEFEKTGKPGRSFQSVAVEGLKRPGRTIGQGFNNWPKDEHGAYIMPDGPQPPQSPRRQSSRSDARKAASAQIAKIPLPLSQHIARVFKP